MNTLLILLCTAAAAIVQRSLLETIGPPAAFVQLPIIPVIFLIGNFRFGTAFAAAAASGVIMDILSPYRFGAFLCIFLILTFLLIFLFTRVLTHRTWPAFVAIHGAGFLAFHAIFLASRTAGISLQGQAADAFSARGGILPFMIALAAQIAFSAGLVAAGRRLKKSFLSTFLVIK